MLHYLILVPYYFFGALTLTLAIILACRLTRRSLAINAVVSASVLGTIASLFVVLSTYHVSIEHFRLLPLLGLLAVSFLLAGIDAVLRKRLPLALDREIEGL
jgi:RsiW-degrading membrane proteinase PrsW (M82 family)